MGAGFGKAWKTLSSLPIFFFDSEFFHCIFELVSFSRSFFTLLFLFGSDSCFFFLFDFQLFLQAHQRSKRLFIDIHFR